jgi:quercetin dioxygenase-like cupin family protein
MSVSVLLRIGSREMTKELEDFNFKKVGQFDVSAIKAIVSDFEEEWLIDTSRQGTFETHKNTMSYFLYKADLKWNQSLPFFVETLVNNIELLDYVEGIVQDLEYLHKGTRGNVLLIKLLAGESIPEHADDGEYLDAARRHHLPIITSDETLFGVGGEKISMQEGDCWEINNSKPHYVINNSSLDRVHLLIDIVPTDRIFP